MKKKEYFRELKKFLNSLEGLRNRYKWLEKEENELENEYVDVISSICSYEAISTSKTYKINHTTEELAYQELKEKEEREVKLKKIVKEKKNIARTFERYAIALEDLNEVERKVIQLSLIEHRPIAYILAEIKYRETAYYKIKNDAMTKMCTSLYGTKFWVMDLPLMEFY